jgi:hypothetical protein
MEIRIKQTGEVIYESEFRKLFPNSSLPQPLTEQLINELGGDIVFEGSQPINGTVYQYSQSAGVEKIGDKWHKKYILGPVFTDGETTAAAQEAAYKAQIDAQQARVVREQRDAKLAETDWRFRIDMNPSQEWKDYCQSLRDITEQSGFPWTINWPMRP